MRSALVTTIAVTAFVSSGFFAWSAYAAESSATATEATAVGFVQNDATEPVDVRGMVTKVTDTQFTVATPDGRTLAIAYDILATAKPPVVGVPIRVLVQNRGGTLFASWTVGLVDM